ncbi:hypothetical protein RHGRI_001021 [Rhododendron griersonianum]|uniref:RNA-dependent RNA polymerase n=1 Tax=Rhododendron griersonianum TaxID=479676 RepID=A0AAV6LJW3_9ERIC|nr:hypothetical protein RHGRI_001021 [Rhododendron griersonianum]
MSSDLRRLYPPKTEENFSFKNLIALLSYGGVPKECFLKILEDELEDSKSAYCKKLAALRDNFHDPICCFSESDPLQSGTDYLANLLHTVLVPLHLAYLFLDAAALNHGEIDDDFIVARLILSGVPLNEPYLQYRLSVLAKEERKALKGGRLPIRESFYLTGTTDPTGILESHEVCVILYLEEIVRNAKYGIFFSTKGERSVANEMAIFDFFGETDLRPGEREARGCSSSTPHGLSPLKASCLCQH